MMTESTMNAQAKPSMVLTSGLVSWEAMDPVMVSSLVMNLVMFFMPMIINYSVIFYLVISVVVVAAGLAWEYQPGSEFRHLYLGNMLLGGSFIWHSLPMGDVPSAARIALTVLQLCCVGLYFTTPYRTEFLFAVLAMWFIPYDNYLQTARIELHLLVLMYSLFWFIHEAFVVKYFKVRMPLQDTLIISLVMFRIIGPWMIIYFAVMNMYKGYLTYQFITEQQQQHQQQHHSHQQDTDPEKQTQPEHRNSHGPEDNRWSMDLPGIDIPSHSRYRSSVQSPRVAEPENERLNDLIPAEKLRQETKSPQAVTQVRPVVKVPSRPIPSRRSIIDTLITTDSRVPTPSHTTIAEIPILSTISTMASNTASSIVSATSNSQSKSTTTGLKKSSLKDKFFSPAI